jgi:signal transduction histidine kinase
VTGKLAALHAVVSSLPDLPVSTGVTARAHEGPSLESPAFVELRTRVAAVLERQAPDIATRWERQARNVALRDEEMSIDSHGPTSPVRLVASFAAALASDGVTTDDAVALGLAFGVEAFEAGASLHHTLKGLDLLSAMIMYAVENAVVAEAGQGDIADGVRLCRRLQQATSLLALAATKGYTQAVSDGLRDRFRLLRHDLRNPLGTIKSVLALMDDESVPADARAHPRFRAMAERNARSLDELIVDRLSDAAALLPALSHQRVSLRVIACGVRRDLRAEAETRDTSVLVGDARVRVCVDAVSLELMLHTLLLAALHESAEGDELTIDFGEPTADRATVLLTRAPGRMVVSDATASTRLAALAARMGSRLTLGETTTLSVPIRREESHGDSGDAPADGVAVRARQPDAAAAQSHQ